MGKYLFPAIFDSGEDGSEGYTITFPDLPGCISEGDDLENAMSMAKDVLEGFLYGMEEDGEEIPSPSNPSELDVPKTGFVVMVHAWTDIVRDEMENKAVKKTLTVPKWLAEAAEKEGVNFSQLLQFALRERLGLNKKSS
ncbi:pilus assembly protein HicB [Bacillus nakamurai]|uniref:type II toxin-antitoxin system HicB family antitoxin n=1 Tax=Bacillus nakamurai TaxID=1793963 RepID=UPI00077851E6|nr:type II toxin-antitoxin system HicB family antitoxin [Bacillus nakamurai]KXZ17906.1 pilus assembly protein HicB [Bacillus nakamurai]